VRNSAGDVGAAFFQRAGDALNPACRRRAEAMASEISAMSWRRSICTPEMALRTCSVADQVVALMGDVLQ
jgi:hypothetical protein